MAASVVEPRRGLRRTRLTGSVDLVAKIIKINSVSLIKITMQGDAEGGLPAHPHCYKLCLQLSPTSRIVG